MLRNGKDPISTRLIAKARNILHAYRVGTEAEVLWRNKKVL